MGTPDGHDYLVRAVSTDTFGRVVLEVRDHRVVVDGPVQNGCLGEAVTPAELFLGAVASCAAELVQVLARDAGVALGAVEAEVGGTIDRSHEVRSDVTVLRSMSLRLAFHGTGEKDAAALVEGFKRR